MGGGYLGLGIFQFPRELVDFAGPDAGWAFLLICLGFLGLLMLFLKVAAIDPDHALGYTLRRLLSPMVGWPLDAFRIVLHFMLAVLVVANFGQVMRSFFLIGTPAWAIEAVLVATSLYTAWYGTAVLARTIEAIFVPTLIGSIAIGALVVHQLRFRWAILPTGHLAVTPTLLAAYHSAYIFIGFEVLAQAYGHVRVDRRPAARRWLFILFATTVVFFAFGYVVTMGTEGPSALATMQWPPVSALRLANISGFFISKLGLLVVVLWGLFAMAFISIRFWCLAHDVGAKTYRVVPPTRYHGALIGVAVVVFAGAQGFRTVVGVVHVFQTWGLPIMMGYLVGLPALLLPAAWWRDRRAEHKASEKAPM